MQYNTWLETFLVGKVEVPSLEAIDKFAAHSLRRFLDDGGAVWEIGITYTNRLVIRSGQIDKDALHVLWNKWETLHEVKMPDRVSR